MLTDTAEIEVKAKVTDRGALEHALARRGCVLGEPIFQRSVVYNKV